MLVRLSLVAGIALLGMALSIVALIGQSEQASDQRAANHEGIEVLSALQCTLLSKDQEPEDVATELNKTGAVQLTASCQRYVTALGTSLVYDNDSGRITRK